MHFTFNNNFFVENHAFYEIMCKNIIQPDWPQMKIGRMHIAASIHQATNINYNI